ncbi:ATP synthase complex assembly protein atp12 [Podila verticillata]|nr:ATP synthase complex assembly protein atp12 [Podila verticillata]
MLRSFISRVPTHATPVRAFHANAALRDQMARAEVSGKRFWENAGIKEVGDRIAITLDGRVLKTPAGNQLTLPKDQRHIALMIAGEWHGQKALLKSHSLPMTSLVARAIDSFIGNEQGRQDTLNRLIKFLDTDSICYQQDFPESIVKAQEKHWTPILDWVKEEYDLNIKVSQGITYVQQDEATKDKLREIVGSMNDIELAAKSFLIGLAVVKRNLSVEKAWTAASLEVLDQIDRWGEVEDSHDVDREYVKSQLASARLANIGAY